MKTTVDRFGRVIVPKGIRDRLGLVPGSEMTIDEHENEVVLKLVDQGAPTKLESGILVFAGAAKSDITDAVRMQREDRLRKVAGKMT
jgi:AbrB family looped-hinge helix DNA binding protein